MSSRKFTALVLFITLSFTAACTTAAEKQQEPVVSPYGISIDTTRRTPADLELISSGKVMVAFAFGQSNSANFGETAYRPRRGAYNYYRGSLYRAEDPLLGAAGLMGSVWTRLADMMVEAGIYERVVFINTGIGATSAECWSEKDCSLYLRETLADLKMHNIKLTHILWHQGEQDNFTKTGRVTYKKHMTKILSIFREYGQDAPMYVCIASYNPMASKKDGYISKSIRQGQMEFINENRGVLLGPDTDSLVSKEYRYDGVHFSTAGLESFAKLWFNAIVLNSEKVK